MNMIVVIFNPFTMESYLSIFRENEGEKRILIPSNAQKAATAIVNYAHLSGIKTVKVHAPTHIYEEMKKVIESIDESKILNIGAF